jgi:hypothetical protein
MDGREFEHLFAGVRLSVPRGGFVWRDHALVHGVVGQPRIDQAICRNSKMKTERKSCGFSVL